MKILVVKPHLPIPPHQGTRRVTLELLRELAPTWDVHYLCMLERPEEALLIPELEELGIEVRAPLMPNRRSAWHRLSHRFHHDIAALVSGYPRDYFYSTPRVLAHELHRWTSDTRFDVVVLEYWKLARLRPFVASGEVAVLAHDAEFVKRARQADALSSHPWHRARARQLGREARREIETLARCENVLVLTESDRRDIGAALGPGYRGQIHVLPVGTDFGPSSNGRPITPGGEEPIVAFVGSFKGDFNVDAAGWLIRDVWPRVRRVRPDARLEIAGGDVPSDLGRHHGRDGISLLGYVADLAGFIARARVFVVPLRFGGGLRIRLVEAMSVGAAVVSTPIGVAGMDLEPGVHFLSGSTPDEFAAAVVRVLQDRALRDQLVAAGRACARSRFAPETIRARRLDLFCALAGERERSRDPRRAEAQVSA